MPTTYYFEIICHRFETGTTMKLFATAQARCKEDAAAGVCSDTLGSLGPSWKVYCNSVSQQYFEMRQQVERHQRERYLLGERACD